MALTTAQTCLYCILTHLHRHSSYRPSPVSELTSVSHPVSKHCHYPSGSASQCPPSDALPRPSKQPLAYAFTSLRATPHMQILLCLSTLTALPFLPQRVRDWVQALSNGTDAFELSPSYLSSFFNLLPGLPFLLRCHQTYFSALPVFIS